LRTGDSIGVWTFDQELHTGEFALQYWMPENAAMTASNITRFVARQRYSKQTHLDALQPYLNAVVLNSDRLTVLIFCDGDDTITWSPFDPGINRIFQQQSAERKRTRQPFILVLRSQLGGYVGCAMNLPPSPIIFPEFPPLPPLSEPTPPLPPAKPSPSNPPPLVPPLIIIGTHVGTNPPPAPKPQPPPPPVALPPAPAPKPALTNAPPREPANAPPATNAVENVKTNPPPPAVPPKPTNAPVTAPANVAVQTNAPVMPPSNPVVRAVVTPTNAAAPAPGNSGLSSKRALLIGAAFLILAGALAVLMWRRASRSDHSSLITRSMNRGGRPPRRP